MKWIWDKDKVNLPGQTKVIIKVNGDKINFVDKVNTPLQMVETIMELGLITNYMVKEKAKINMDIDFVIKNKPFFFLDDEEQE